MFSRHPASHTGGYPYCSTSDLNHSRSQRAEAILWHFWLGALFFHQSFPTSESGYTMLMWSQIQRQCKKCLIILHIKRISLAYTKLHLGQWLVFVLLLFFPSWKARTKSPIHLEKKPQQQILTLAKPVTLMVPGLAFIKRRLEQYSVSEQWAGR